VYMCINVCVCVCMCVCSKYCVKAIAARYRLVQQHVFDRECMHASVCVLRRRGIS